MTSRSGRVIAVLLLTTGLFNSVVAYLFWSEYQSFRLPVIAGTIALALPTVIAAVFVLLRPARQSVSLAAGVSIVSALGALSLGSLTFLGAWNPGDAEGIVKFVAILVLPNLVVAIFVIVLAVREFGMSAPGALVLGFAAAVAMDTACGLLAGVVMTAIGIGANLQYGSRDTRLSHALTHVQACAIEYAEQNPDNGYPATLDDLGPGGLKCLDSKALVEARQMNVRYVAEATTSSGTIPSFAVYGHTSVADGADIRASGDTSGTMSTFSAGEGADTLALPNGIERTMRRIAWLRNCALFDRHRGQPSAFPERMDALLRIGSKRGQLELLMGCQHTSDVSHEGEGDTFIYEGHRLAYRPERSTSGAVEHFAIEARPVTYGVTAVNSYLLRDEGPVYRTRSDRAATPSDAVIPACRYADSVTTTPRNCVELARPRIDPSVALLHPREAGRDESVALYARDARDTSRAPDPTLWIGFSCEADSIHLENITPPPVSHRLDHVCTPWGWDPAKPYPVMLYIRDSLGGISWRIDSIKVRAGS
ncbi:MAG: hypothetical protein ABI625_14690 [bacterium]